MPKPPPTPDQRYVRLYQDMDFLPVFIIGAHRSGTTLLYRLLAESGCFNAVRAYHVIHSGEIVSQHLEGRAEAAQAQLRDKLAGLGVSNRIIDEGPASPEAPAEYGFIMAPASRRPRLTPETLPTFTELCRKIQFTQDPAKALILKNPWDAVRFAYIKQALPRAKFIFTHRHPMLVMNSFLLALRSVLEAPNGYLGLLAPWYAQLFHRPVNLWLSRLAVAPGLPVGTELMGRYMVRVARYFVEAIGSLPPEDYVQLRYEDLCAAPQQRMEDLFRFLAVTPARPVAYEQQIRPRRIQVLPEIRRKCQAILPQLQPYLALQHYDAEPAGMAAAAGA